MVIILPSLLLRHHTSSMAFTIKKSPRGRLLNRPHAMTADRRSGSVWLCEHDKVPSVCRDRVCGGASICMHQIVRSTCKACGMQDAVKPRSVAGSMQQQLHQQHEHEMAAIQSLGAGLLPAPQMLMPMPPLNTGGAARLALQARWLAQVTGHDDRRLAHGQRPTR